MDPLLIEQKDPEFKNPSLGGRVNFSASTHLSFLEIPSFPMTPKRVDGRILEGKIEEDYILQEWLSKGINHFLPVDSDNLVKGPKGGLRLLYGTCSWDLKAGLVLPMTDNAFDSIKEGLGLPDYFLKFMRGKGFRTLKHSSKNSKGHYSVCFIFKVTLFQPSYYQLALSYCPKTSLTTGLLLSKSSEVKIAEIVEHLKISPLASYQPLYLTTLISEVAIDSSHDRIRDLDTSLGNLEQTMGQHEYSNLPRGNPLKFDLMKATRRLNFFVRTFTAEAMRLGSMLLTLEQIKEYQIYIQKSAQFGKEKIEPDILEESNGEQMNEKVNYLKNICQNTLLRAEFETKRAQSLIQVVFQFMAHKNAVSNIDLAVDTSTIAIETKKDSASMKTIAMMGMVFLPSVSLAAVFAMPVFNWDARGASIVKPGFGYYMAVAIPLTLVVLLIWGLAMRRGQKAHISRDIELSEL